MAVILGVYLYRMDLLQWFSRIEEPRSACLKRLPRMVIIPIHPLESDLARTVNRNYILPVRTIHRFTRSRITKTVVSKISHIWNTYFHLIYTILFIYQTITIRRNRLDVQVIRIFSQTARNLHTPGTITVVCSFHFCSDL